MKITAPKHEVTLDEEELKVAVLMYIEHNTGQRLDCVHLEHLVGERTDFFEVDVPYQEGVTVTVVNTEARL